MFTINKGFVNRYGIEYPTIRDIHFDSIEDTRNNFGIYKACSTFAGQDISSWSLNEEDGVYIYQTHYDDKKALRIYQDWLNYKYVYHESECKLVSRLLEYQKSILLSEFPTGIVSLENHVIGQEVPFYGEGYITVLEALTQKKCEEPTSLYLKMLNILDELYTNGIIYRDGHFRNFMYNTIDGDVKIIDFESSSVSFVEDDPAPCVLNNSVLNFKKRIDRTISDYGIELGASYEKASTFGEVKEAVLEKHHSLIKKI